MSYRIYFKINLNPNMDPHVNFESRIQNIFLITIFNNNGMHYMFTEVILYSQHVIRRLQDTDTTQCQAPVMILSDEDLCAWREYQGQEQVITPYQYCWM